MGVFVENLRMEECKICCDVWDTKDEGIEATVTAEIENHGSLVKNNEKLYAKERTIKFEDTPKLGDTRNVKVILKAADGRSYDQTKPLYFCSE